MSECVSVGGSGMGLLVLVWVPSSGQFLVLLLDPVALFFVVQLVQVNGQFQHLKQKARQTSRQSVSQLVSPSVRQSVRQSVSQSVSQSVRQAGSAVGGGGVMGRLVLCTLLWSLVSTAHLRSSACASRTLPSSSLAASLTAPPPPRPL